MCPNISIIKSVVVTTDKAKIIAIIKTITTERRATPRRRADLFFSLSNKLLKI